jgi:hypothetical protein
MKKKQKSIYFILLLIPLLTYSQKSVNKTSVWYGKMLRIWFDYSIPIRDSNYPLSEIKCSENDITHFNAKAGKFNKYSSSFYIKGNVKIDAFPSELKDFIDNPKKRYKLLLGAYLLNSSGELVWRKSDYPTDEDKMIKITGDNKDFNVESQYKGEIEGNIAVIIAFTDSIAFKEGTKNRIILGIKRYSFNEKDYISTGYNPSDLQKSKKDKKYYNIQGNGYFEVGDKIVIPADSYISDYASDLIEVLSWADKGKASIVNTLIAEKDGIRHTTYQLEGIVTEVKRRIIEVDNDYWVTKMRAKEKF